MKYLLFSVANSGRVLNFVIENTKLFIDITLYGISGNKFKIISISKENSSGHNCSLDTTINRIILILFFKLIVNLGFFFLS